jgi:serine/threonine-protein kinase RsbW
MLATEAFKDPDAEKIWRIADTANSSDVYWAKTYPGLVTTVREVRRDVRGILGPCPEPIADDAVLIASELVTNAIRHSRSGAPDGTYLVRVHHCVTEKVPYVWIEVEDQGNPSWDGTLCPEPTHGLSVIQSISTWMGSDDGPEGQRTVYARLDYSVDGTPLYTATGVPELPPDLDGVRELRRARPSPRPTLQPPHEGVVP